MNGPEDFAVWNTYHDDQIFVIRDYFFQLDELVFACFQLTQNPTSTTVQFDQKK